MVVTAGQSGRDLWIRRGRFPPPPGMSLPWPVEVVRRFCIISRCRDGTDRRALRRAPWRNRVTATSNAICRGRIRADTTQQAAHSPGDPSWWLQAATDGAREGSGCGHIRI